MKQTLIKTVLALATGFVMMHAEAKYIYAMVSDAKNVYNDNPIEFSYMTVKGDGMDYLYYYTFDGSTTSATGYQALDSNADNRSTGAVLWDATSSTDEPYQTFLFELWTDQNTRIGWQNYTLAQLSKGVYENGAVGSGDLKPFTVSEVIPEPTSGILLLLGMAGLALRRRRA